jgi:hypothetical protein
MFKQQNRGLGQLFGIILDFILIQRSQQSQLAWKNSPSIHTRKTLKQLSMKFLSEFPKTEHQSDKGSQWETTYQNLEFRGVTEADFKTLPTDS